MYRRLPRTYRGGSTVRRGLRTVALLAAMVASGASSCAAPDGAGAEPGRSAPADDVAAPPSTVVDDQLRRADVPVPPDFRLRGLAFNDVSTGYAVFSRCDAFPADAPSAVPPVAGSPGVASGPPGAVPSARPCAATLLVTLDGGTSWLARPLPFGDAQTFTLRPGPADRLLLRAEPYGWFESTDRGRSFQSWTGTPPESGLVPGGYTILCAGPEGRPCPARVGRVDPDGAARPVPAQPDLPGRLTHATGTGDRVLAVSVRDGRLYAAVSTDQGRHWRRLDPPAPARPVASGAVLAAPDGADVWLAGTPAGASFPLLWRLNGTGGWRPVPATGRPDGSALLVAVGGGELIASVDGDFGAVVDGGARWERRTGPVAVASVRVLADGGIEASDAAGRMVWLCRCSRGDRRWVRISLVPTG